jgi:hypothetical protein
MKTYLIVLIAFFFFSANSQSVELIIDEYCDILDKKLEVFESNLKLSLLNQEYKDPLLPFSNEIDRNYSFSVSLLSSTIKKDDVCIHVQNPIRNSNNTGEPQTYQRVVYFEVNGEFELYYDIPYQKFSTKDAKELKQLIGLFTLTVDKNNQITFSSNFIINLEKENACFACLPEGDGCTYTESECNTLKNSSLALFVDSQFFEQGAKPQIIQKLNEIFVGEKLVSLFLNYTGNLKLIVKCFRNYKNYLIMKILKLFIYFYIISFPEFSFKHKL